MGAEGSLQAVIAALLSEYPDAKITLKYRDPLELLVATVLSAQSTDKIVNEVTRTLFRKYTSPEDYANADLRELEDDIRATGFYRKKAKYLKSICQMLIDVYDSKVPATMDELIKLPGVARKTANIVLSKAFGVVEGIAVDTHVQRLSLRLGFSTSKNPEKTEKSLMKLTPMHLWTQLTDLLIHHGRRICRARKPLCKECLISGLCPSAFTFE